MIFLKIYYSYISPLKRKKNHPGLTLTEKQSSGT